MLEHLCNRSRADAHDSPRTLFERSETRTMTKSPPPSFPWHIAFVLGREQRAASAGWEKLHGGSVTEAGGVHPQHSNFISVR